MTISTTPVSEFKLLYVHGGSLTVRCADRVLLIPDTFGILTPANIKHSKHATPGAKMQEILLRPFFTSNDLSDTINVNPSPLAMALIGYASCLPEISEKRQNAEAVVVDLLAPASSAYRLPLPADPRLLRAAENVLDDPIRPHPNSQGATLADMTPGTFTRLFLAQTGVFWADWCFAAKMHEAMRLLNRGKSVGEVYHLVNYKTPSTFISAFTRHFGVTPGASRPHTVCGWCGHTKYRRAKVQS